MVLSFKVFQKSRLTLSSWSAFYTYRFIQVNFNVSVRQDFANYLFLSVYHLCPYIHGQKIMYFLPLFPVRLLVFLADPFSVKIWDPSQNLALYLLWLRGSFNDKIIVNCSNISSLSSFRCLVWVIWYSSNLLNLFSVGKLVIEEKNYWIKMCFLLLCIQILHYWREWEFCQ